MPDDVSLNKLAIIERCLRRVAEEYRGDPARLENFTIQDSVVLNVQRACEAAIDMAMHVIAVRRLGVPQDAHPAAGCRGTSPRPENAR
ncbi:MAG: type VII toxin-antitoxin system HepT family RNase toxin [Planctomycetaceae bacterium]